MRMKSLILALASVAFLASCAELKEVFGGGSGGGGGYRVPAGCDEHAHVCKVQLTVDHCTLHDKTSIKADPYVRHVPQGTWVIQWEIATSGYEFPDDGIEMKRNYGGVFVKRGKSGTGFQWVDHNAQHDQTYEYSVHIVRKGGADCASYDPDIYND